MDEPSLSEQEQRILEEIERNLAADDPDFARKVRSPRSRRAPSNLLRVGVLGLIVGLGLLLANVMHTAFGVLGFLVMLAGAVAIGTALRGRESGGASSRLRDAWKRAENRMRSRRKDDDE